MYTILSSKSYIFVLLVCKKCYMWSDRGNMGCMPAGSVLGRNWYIIPLQSGKPKNLLLSVKWTYQSSFMFRPQVGRAVTWIIRPASECEWSHLEISPFFSSQYPKCLVLAVFLVLTYAVGARRRMARSSWTVVSVALWKGGWRTVILHFSILVPTIITRGRIFRRGLLLGVRRNKEDDKN
jgi:hypothetical protein